MGSCEELSELDRDPSGYFVLTEDLDCSGTTLVSIGRRRPFEGTLDGTGHVISGIVVESGLFHSISNAHIMELGIAGAELAGHGMVGALAGQATHSTITDVAVRDSTLRATGNHVGGLVGRAVHTNITNSYVRVDIVSRRPAGALVGSATQSQIATSYAVVAQAEGVVAGQVPLHVGVTDTFFDSDVAVGSNDASALGAATTLDLQSRAFLEAARWNFESVWGFHGPGYPCLRWEAGCTIVNLVVDSMLVPEHEDRDYGAYVLPVVRMAHNEAGFDFFANTFAVESSPAAIDAILTAEGLHIVEVDEPQAWDDSDHLYLVQRTPRSPLCSTSLEVDLRAEEPELDGVLSFSSAAALDTLCVVLRMLRAGHLVDLDGPMDQDTYSRGSANISVGAVALSKNVFDWVDFAGRAGVDYSIPQAWEALAAMNVTPHVRGNIADAGFALTPDFDGVAGESFVPGQGIFESSRHGSPWHGAACAAAFSAVATNDWGVVGTAGVFLEQTKVWGVENLFQARRAFRHARRQSGASILSISLSFNRPRALRFLGRGLQRDATITRRRGTLVFASAGNESDELAGSTMRQLPCELEDIECVGGLGRERVTLAPSPAGSNWGPMVDLFAPYQGAGFNASAPPANEISQLNGTSYTTPWVAGVAALVWTADPTLSPAGVAEVLRSTARSSIDPRVWWIVDPYEAVVAALGVRPPRVDLSRSHEERVVQSGTALLVLARLTAGDATIARVALSSDRLGVVSTVNSPVGTFEPLIWIPDGTALGRHVLDVIVEDVEGRATSEAFEIFVEPGEDCPDISHLSATFVASSSLGDLLRLEADVTNALSEDILWTVDAEPVGTGSVVEVFYNGPGTFCADRPYIIVQAGHADGCAVFAPVNEVYGCP